MAIGDIGLDTGKFYTGANVDSGKQLGQDAHNAYVNPLYIEEYGGEVESQIIKTSIMKQFVKLKSVRGTDTITNDRIGTTSLQAVEAGVRPNSGEVQFDKVSVKVDTIVLARNNVHLLDDFQAHYNVRAELGQDHGKVIGRFFDEAVLIQGVKAARSTTTLPGWVDGTVVDLAASSDESDPDKLQRAIEDLCEQMESKDLELEGGVLFVAPAQYYTLLRNDKLISMDFSAGNGTVAGGMVLKSCGIPIMKTNRMAQAPVTGHYLSNTGNSAAYDVSAEEAKVVALFLKPKALLAGDRKSVV